jgi:REP element-mobilizing transposase RayT
MSERRTGDLHTHRWSAPGARYFVTCATAQRSGGLTAPSVGGHLMHEVMASDRDLDTETSAFVVMPNHVHWLFRMGARLSLGRTIAKFKSRTRSRLAAAGLAWQRDFYEHRLRFDENAEAYARYIFLNPYRAGLLPVKAVWPGWWTADPGALDFMGMLNPDGTPPEAWIGEAVQAGLAVGE